MDIILDIYKHNYDMIPIRINQYDYGMDFNVKLMKKNESYLFDKNDRVSVEWYLPGHVGYIDPLVTINKDVATFKIRRSYTRTDGIITFSVIIRRDNIRFSTRPIPVEVYKNSLSEKLY